MTLLLVAIGATLVLFLVSMCPTIPSRRGIGPRIAACFRWVVRAFATPNPLDDTQH